MNETREEGERRHGALRILALVPAHNEAPRVGAVVAALVAQGLMVLVVDDGSTDDTAQVARAAGARHLSLSPNRGKGAALKAGFREALAYPESADVPIAPATVPQGQVVGAATQPPAPTVSGWDAIITLDADGQHDPAAVPLFVERWQATGADLVIGARDYRRMPPIRWFTNTVSRLLLSSALGQRVPDNQSGYRLRSPRVAAASLESPEQGFAFEVEEIAICVGRGYKINWVLIETIYGTEVSDIKPWTHFVSFLRVTGRARRIMKAQRRR